MALVENMKRFIDRLRNISVSTAALLALSSGLVGCNSKEQVKDVSPSDKKQEPTELPAEIANPVRRVEYYTDTLDGRSWAALYYSNGKITRNYVEKDSRYRMQLDLFAHEDWHAHNNKINWRYMKDLSPSQFYRLCMHDEISANIAGLLTIRFEYLAAEDKQSFIEKHRQSYYYGFYFEAIEAGYINPESNDPSDLEREYNFIMNSTQKEWIERRYRTYFPSLYRMLQRNIKRNGINIGNEKKYKGIVKYMYKIGGVDFFKYMEKDVTPGDDRVQFNENIGAIPSFTDVSSDMVVYTDNTLSLLDSVCAEKYNEAFQHLLISANLKSKLKDFDIEYLKENPHFVDMYHRHIMSKLKSDLIFASLINVSSSQYGKNNLLRAHNEDEYQNIISKMYELNGIDLSKCINNFSTDYVPFPLYSTGLSVFEYSQYLPFEIKADKLYAPAKTADNSSNVNKSQKKRISEPQYIDIPEFRESILLDPTLESNKHIFKVIEDFNNIPQVLKECDTGAQKKYYAASKKNKSHAAKIRRKHSFGR